MGVEFRLLLKSELETDEIETFLQAIETDGSVFEPRRTGPGALSCLISPPTSPHEWRDVDIDVSETEVFVLVSWATGDDATTLIDRLAGVLHSMGHRTTIEEP